MRVRSKPLRGAASLVAFLCAAAAGSCGSSNDAGPTAGNDASAPPSDAGDASAPGCSAGQHACNGACVDFATSATSCGACGRACGGGQTCCGGASCSSDPACGFTVGSIAPVTGLINGGTYVTVHGTGFAKGLSAYVGDGRAPVRVVDDKTAVLVTPPAPQGVYAIELRAGGAKATLPDAFTVTSQTFSDAWVTVQMSTPRGNFPGLATLQDGRVLVEGGTSTSDPSTALPSAELFDPKTNAFTVTPGKMSVARQTTTAITLLDGRALVLGVCNTSSGDGCVTPGDRAIAETFDPATGTFTPTKPLNDPSRVYFRPVLLPDGRVLVTSASASGTAEIFDPDSNAFTTLSIAASGAPVRLRDGRILFVGASLEVLDPDTLTLTALGGGTLDHAPEGVFTLPDGKVGGVGGTASTNNGMNTPTDALVLIDPGPPTLTTLPQKLASPRLKFGSALLGSGVVMAAGGVTAPYPLTYSCASDTFPTTKAVDVVDFASGADHAFPPLNDSEMELVATTLDSGSILVAGGAACGGGVAYAHAYFLQGTPSPK